MNRYSLIEPESPVLTPRMAPHQLPNGYSAPLAMDSASGSPVVVEESKTVQMKKRLGLMGGTALIVGTMIGSGIFVSPKGVLAGCGSIGLSLVIWVSCGVISLFGALTYAELGTLITKSGAEYVYLLEAGQVLPNQFAPIPAFLFAWVSIFILKPALFGVIALSFGIYAVEPFFGDCEVPDVLVKLVAILCICIVSFVNCYSVKLANKVQIVFTVAKLLAIGVIVVGGFIMLAQGNNEYLMEGFQDTTHDLSSIALAFYDGLWAYDGWNNLNYATEELQNPFVNLPRAIMIGIPLVTVCYLLTNISYLTVMSKETLLQSPAVAATWGSRVLGPASLIIPLAVALSTFGAANGSCFTGCRLAYVAAREHHLPEVLSYVQINNFTPLPSVIFSTIVTILMIIPGNIFSLIDFFSFTAWLFYGATMACVLILRHTRPHEPRPYRVPTAIPVVMLIISVYLVVAPIAHNPRIEFLYATLFVLSGMIFYIPFIACKVRLTFLNPLVTAIQCALQVAPSAYLPPE
ncbi:b(0,+)-type amino acid transporter 1-like isoform X1 [Pomacea canaliculata]|uniref:b(0,+)-type amino acid transporter 1-like isoform X1 n=2 Tax=Pomacea canaliculata TaxID=400727 RepID=UPI000D73C851|nr:b(0,+)-type amino acid transporter 1-like isoform X1 [Pomacea canaliculata]